MNKNHNLIKKPNSYLSSISNKISITDKLLSDFNIRKLLTQLQSYINKSDWIGLYMWSINIIKKHPNISLGYLGKSVALYYRGLSEAGHDVDEILRNINKAVEIIKFDKNLYKNIFIGNKETETKSRLIIYALYWQAEVYFIHFKNETKFAEIVKDMLMTEKQDILSKTLSLVMLTDKSLLSEQCKEEYYNWEIDNKIYLNLEKEEDLLALAFRKSDLGKLKDAINTINMAIKIDSNNPDYYILRGYWKEKLGDFEGAKLDKRIADKMNKE